MTWSKKARPPPPQPRMVPRIESEEEGEEGELTPARRQRRRPTRGRKEGGQASKKQRKQNLSPIDRTRALEVSFGCSFVFFLSSRRRARRLTKSSFGFRHLGTRGWFRSLLPTPYLCFVCLLPVRVSFDFSTLYMINTKSEKSRHKESGRHPAAHSLHPPPPSFRSSCSLSYYLPSLPSPLYFIQRRLLLIHHQIKKGL